MRERSDAVPQGAIAFPNRMSAYPVLSGESLQRLLGIQIMSGHIARPKGSVLFTEGENVLGVYVIWGGRVKLSIGSDNGKSLILGLVNSGTVIDLPEAILGLPHAATAEVVNTARLSFLSRDDLLRHLRATNAAAYSAAEMVSSIYYSVLAEIKTSHSQPAEQKVARFLLGLRPTPASSNGETQVMLELSQEEIGQMIGVSRETVARIISRFKKERILELKSAMLIIHDTTALARLAELPERRENAGTEV